MRATVAQEWRAMSPQKAKCLDTVGEAAFQKLADGAMMIHRTHGPAEFVRVYDRFIAFVDTHDTFTGVDLMECLR